MDVLLAVFVFNTVLVMSVLTARVPLQDTYRSPLFVDLNVSAMNEELQDYIQQEVNDTCYDKIDVAVKDKHNEFKAGVLMDVYSAKKAFRTELSSFIGDIKTQFENLKKENDEYKTQLAKEYKDKLAAMRSENDDKMSERMTKYDSDFTSLEHDFTFKFKEHQRNINREKEVFNAEQEAMAQKNNLELKSEIEILRNRVSSNEKRVALTACVASGKKYSGPVIFGSIKTNTGINNIDAFRSTGKFKVTTSGLYLISAYIRSKYNSYAFYIRKNGTIIVASVTSVISSWSTSSIVSVIEANKNDEIYVDGNGILIDSYYSCISIIKVK